MKSELGAGVHGSPPAIYLPYSLLSLTAHLPFPIPSRPSIPWPSIRVLCQSLGCGKATEEGDLPHPRFPCRDQAINSLFPLPTSASPFAHVLPPLTCQVGTGICPSLPLPVINLSKLHSPTRGSSWAWQVLWFLSLRLFPLPFLPSRPSLPTPL